MYDECEANLLDYEDEEPDDKTSRRYLRLKSRTDRSKEEFESAKADRNALRERIRQLEQFSMTAVAAPSTQSAAGSRSQPRRSASEPNPSERARQLAASMQPIQNVPMNSTDELTDAQIDGFERSTHSNGSDALDPNALPFDENRLRDED